MEQGRLVPIGKPRRICCAKKMTGPCSFPDGPSREAQNKRSTTTLFRTSQTKEGLSIAITGKVWRRVYQEEIARLLVLNAGTMASKPQLSFAWKTGSVRVADGTYDKTALKLEQDPCLPASAKMHQRKPAALQARTGQAPGRLPRAQDRPK